MNNKLRQILPTTTIAAVLACLLLAAPAAADQVIADDLIVQSSICVGVDCVNGENFGFDTIRLKENNLRIKFEDTSVGTFPTTDWELTANDSASGGAGRFTIRDVTAARDIFTVRASAPTNSIFVDSAGRVGLRTSTPVLDLHVATGNTPAIRLEQNTSSGFSAQTWDVAGNEANFFVRDVTSGSKLPFRIRPGAPNSSIDIAADGDVGIGTASPTESLHVVDTADNPRILVTGGNFAALALETTTAATPGKWAFVHKNNGDFAFQDVTGAANERMTLTRNGNVTIAGGLVTTGGGGACTVGDPCDGVFAPEYHVESIEEHASFMWGNSYLKGVGPTTEDGPINITRKTGGLINELEKAHIYIERLNEKLKDKGSEINELQERLARLEALLAQQ